MSESPSNYFRVPVRSSPCVTAVAEEFYSFFFSFDPAKALVESSENLQMAGKGVLK